ncbi:MAG: DUF1826 domain-containing protein [Pseudomonadota bacterium]
MNEICTGSFEAALQEQTLSGIHLADSPSDLARILDPDVAMVLWHRAMPEHVHGWIDGLSRAVLPHIRAIVPVVRIPVIIADALDLAGMPDCPERTFLIEDIAELAARFATLTEVAHVRLRLSAVETDSCRKFHVDAAKARFICTYRGPGSQYGFSPDGSEPDEIFESDTGAPMVLRGLAWREARASGLVHRSPPIEGTGQTRLVLMLDPIEDPAADD